MSLQQPVEIDKILLLQGRDSRKVFAINVYIRKDNFFRKKFKNFEVINQMKIDVL